MAESGEAAELYQAREQRLKDVIALKVPDRVPVVYWSMFWHAAYGGRSIRDVMYDYDLSAKLFMKALNDLQPDGVAAAFMLTSIGPELDLAGYRPMRWPGHGVADNGSYQYVDQEFMKADEYDLYIEDPTFFCMSRFAPRVAEAFAPLAKLPQYSNFVYFDLLHSTACYADPEVVQGFARLAEVGAEAQRMLGCYRALFQEITAAGIPSVMGGRCWSPFDYFADFLRGSKGIMLDIYRKKDKLLEAMERAIPILIRNAVALGRRGPCNIIFMPMHWGLDGFMSLPQFKTFFWPQLRRVMMGLIEHDVVPCVLWEGDCTSRLETIGDIPPGKAIYCFERTDIFKAKEVLGDRVCLRGNVQASLLNTGTADEVTAYCRRLIEGVGKNGGFIMDGAIGVPDDARPDNVFAMFRSVHEYGRYR
jgi:hypothetical protein